MKNSEAKKLSTIQKAKILKEIIDGKPIDQFFHDFSASQMKCLRDFLEKELQYISNLQDKNPLDIKSIKSRYVRASEYYRNQDCHEPLESCLDESCYTTNPICFSMKMSSHILVLQEILRPYLKKEQ
ncbi:MAG: hypothetical protein GQ561_01280 [Calditrichae bacterium]|nr:hypothetical protein [Calditrichia bacterium]